MSAPNKATADKADSLIVIGRFGAPFAARGWLRIINFGGGATFLRNKEWQCAPPHSENFRPIKVQHLRMMHGGVLTAKLDGIDDRDCASQWTNGHIAIARECLPALESEDEHYWCDLIGMRALDPDGEVLGTVSGLMRTGAHDILRIAPADDGAEILVPFVDAHVLKTDSDNRQIHLHWKLDWR